MKVIVSHDVDHLSYSEHAADLFIPKFAVRSAIECGLRHISVSEFVRRGMRIWSNRFHNLGELMEFDRAEGITSTFFFAVANGKGLTYRPAEARPWIRRAMEGGFDVGVHGIAFEDEQEVRREHDAFRDLSGLGQFGIRMHYLRRSDTTLGLLAGAGYSFDSTYYGLQNPYRVGRMWEFPLQIMDVDIIRKNASWQNICLDEATEDTKKMIGEACDRGITHLSVNFHDRFFCREFETWMEWYGWLIRYLKDCGHEFTSYQDAMAEIEGGTPCRV